MDHWENLETALGALRLAAEVTTTVFITYASYELAGPMKSTPMPNAQWSNLRVITFLKGAIGSMNKVCSHWNLTNTTSRMLDWIDAKTPMPRVLD
ncbi:hypothetical protein PM082_006326 [Marasmius tenuissimus]|nr:hypothetical protein PM082_006326 [Marasmius tenuissimus]